MMLPIPPVVPEPEPPEKPRAARLAARVYIVFGSTGEGEDVRTWPVHGFTNETEAREYVVRVNDWCVENKVSIDNRGDDILPTKERDNLRRRQLCPFDPTFEADYTGTHYYMRDVPLNGEP